MSEMSRDKAIKLLRGGYAGVAEWNEWRGDDISRPMDLPDLSNADLSRVILRRAILAGLHLEDANFSGTNLDYADLQQTNLKGACLTTCLADADLTSANLECANLVNANLLRTNLEGANLEQADLTNANLVHSYFLRTKLFEAELQGTKMGGTVFSAVDMSSAKNLHTVFHHRPSTIGIDTLELSQGLIPEVFLQGSGLKPWQILESRLYNPDLNLSEFIDLQYKILDARMSGPLLLGRVFISYSSKDYEFANKLKENLEAKGISVYLDKHNLVAGPLQQQIDDAISLHDAVILVLSEASVISDWVEHEMKTARRIERDEGRNVLCPVSLDDAWKAIRYNVNWEHLTDKNILDFSNWETKDFDSQFTKLLKGLKIYYTRDETR